MVFPSWSDDIWLQFWGLHRPLSCYWPSDNWNSCPWGSCWLINVIYQYNPTTLYLMVFFQRAKKFTGSNITFFQAPPTHVNFEVSTTPSWMVEEWNGLESSHPRFPCSENLGFWKIFKLKYSFALQMILSDCSMWIVPYQSIVLSLFILLLKSLHGVQVGIKYVAYLPCIYCKVKSRIQWEKCHF